ncbi:MAG TPA: R3H domain-containing nucleic acid-binding protein [Thermoanaerobaculia bacterium]|nr:R3H domain-containing nucleic acid-binding protein [Thermoanaerobaculia bacterium]
MTKRKFFTGNSVRAALIAAASHFDIPADEIAYREVDKKHGFLKLRKKVIIEVDGDDPRNPPVFVEPESSHTAAAGGGRGRGRGKGKGKKAKPQPPPMRDVEEDEDAPDYGEPVADDAEETPPGPPIRSAVAAPSRSRGRGRGDDGRDAGESRDAREGRGGGQRGSKRGSQRKDDEGGGRGRGRGRGGRGGEKQAEAPQDEKAPEKKPESKPEPKRDEPKPEPKEEAKSESRGGERSEGGESKGGGRRRGRGRGRGRGGKKDESLVELRERPRSASERYEEASGDIADACRESLDRILDVAGVELEYKVFEGEDRLEVELHGEDEELMVAEDGELLLAVEHLLPRAMRGICGEGVQVRVDCADFHEIHEERLRSLAQKVASEVRRNGKPKKLEPLNPADRRIVHLTLTDEPDVTSASEGRGHYKRIVVRPD